MILYGLMRRIRSSRQLEYACGHNIDFSWLAEGRIGVAGLYALHAPSQAQAVYQALLSRSTDRLLAIFDWGGENR